MDLYFDPSGERRVVDTLAREGYHLSVVPTATPPEAGCLATSIGDTQSSSSAERGDRGLSVLRDPLPDRFVRACCLAPSPWRRMQQLACGLDDHEI